jgi:nitrate reductase gamma subunit
MQIFLWVIVPYIALTVFVGGLAWRYRYDKLGWTTRSTQLYERRLLNWGSPLFHFGILGVFVGHVFGILVPEALTAALGVPESLYADSAIGIGGLAGACLLAGMVILLYRRLTVGPVTRTTTVSDKIMYLLLAALVVVGLTITVAGIGHRYDYRDSVAPWFRSIFLFHPDTRLIASAPIGYQLHVMIAWALIAFWPFCRLVHAFSVPFGYATRPYLLYRSRDPQYPQIGVRTVPRGWEQGGWAEQRPPSSARPGSATSNKRSPPGSP